MRDNSLPVAMPAGFFYRGNSGVVRLMVFQRYRPAAEDHQRPPARPAPGMAPMCSRWKPSTDADSPLPHQRASANTNIKDAREPGTYGDVGGIRRGSQHFYLHTEADNRDRHAPEDTEQHQMMYIVRGRQEQQQAGQQQPIAMLISPEACWLPSLPNRMLPIIPARRESAAAR